MKIYQKRGALNYKEKRLVNEIEKAIQEKGGSVDFSPATNFEELKALHNELTVEDVEYEENSDNAEDNHKQFRDGMKESLETNDDEEVGRAIDPLLDGEVITRDYVMDNGFKDEENSDSPQKTIFEEPIDTKTSFELPNEDDEKGQGKHNVKAKKEVKKDAPLNPKFDEMSDAKKKRSTKRFAKMIVDAVCLLAEKGCIWWTTKNITEDKLAKYEIDGEMNLQILLTLEDNQQATVRQWFAQKEQEAQTLFKVDETDKSDLIDSLYEVMLEKGIAPTPMQELIINSVKVFLLDMGLKAYALSAQINNVLGQLRAMNSGGGAAAASDDVVDDTDIDQNPATMDDNGTGVVQETGLVTQNNNG